MEFRFEVSDLLVLLAALNRKCEGPLEKPLIKCITVRKTYYNEEDYSKSISLMPCFPVQMSFFELLTTPEVNPYQLGEFLFRMDFKLLPRYSALCICRIPSENWMQYRLANAGFLRKKCAGQN